MPSTKSIIVVDAENPDVVIFEYAQDWNLISLPINVADGRPQAVLGPHWVEGAIYGYEGMYVDVALLEVGKAYWARFTQTGSIPLVGNAVLGVAVSVGQGWNFIGSCSDMAGIEDTEEILVEGSMYGFSGGYNSVDPFMTEPGKGYWINAHTAGEILLEV